MCHWNIKGLGDKLDNDEIVGLMDKYDVCIFTETWKTEKIKIRNFHTEHLPAVKTGKKSGRFSGGVMIFIKEKYKNIIKSINNGKYNYGIWLKIDKNYLASESGKHIYICGIYIPPKDSDYALKNPYEDLEKDIGDLSETGSTILMGDYNARTGNLADYLLDYSGDKKIDVDFVVNSYEPKNRINSDFCTNSYGRKLIDVCKNTNISMLNGRMNGDVPGKFTFHSSIGSSVIDYALVSSELMDQIVYFNVGNANPWSDHNCISTCMKLPLKKNSQSSRKYNLIPLTENYHWTKESSEKFKSVFNSTLIKAEIAQIINRTYSKNDTDIISNDVTNIYQKVAKLSLKKKRLYKQKKSNMGRSYKQDMEYRNLRKKLDNLAFLFDKYPKDPFIRGRFFHLKKNFSKILKKINRQNKEQILNKIQDLEEKNPTAFWKLVNTLKEKKQSHEEVQPEIFYDYFKELHKGIKNAHHNLDFKCHINSTVVNLVGKEWVDLLDKKITYDEIKKAVKQCKNKKACCFDNVSNEMIKCSFESMSDILMKLFNHILQTELFPKEWAKGYISPIFKKGDLLDPSNYRGITVSSCLGKLFTRVINNRLNEFLIKNGVISVNQIGFSPGKRTCDHIFVLKVLLDQAKYKKNHLYMCFVDLKSAFDTVWREGLLYKLNKINASQKFINIIKNMYEQVNACIKSQHGYTNSFPIEVGTRQGCNLSPTLFNIYINDLPRELDKMSANQPSLEGKKISCLLYADDLILFSKSASGLQRLISETENFCNKWQLTINVKKTKILIAHKKQSNNQCEFYLYGKTVEIVKSFCYLGLEIDCRGSFKKAIERLYSKAFRAYMGVRSNFNFYNNTSVKVMVKLFDTIITPIMLYGCELWGVYGWRINNIDCITKYMLYNNHKFEKLQAKFCKNVLGLNKQTPDILAKAELGRYPLMNNILKLSYSYWQHLLSAEKDSLLNLALNSSIVLDRQGHTTYYSRIKGMLQVLDSKDKIYPVRKNKVKQHSNEIKRKFHIKYDKYFFDILKMKSCSSSAGKFEMYCKYKKCYRAEKYLYNVHDHNLRRHITGIRCASNLMPINNLRRKNVKRELRYCTLCDIDKLGSEFHIMCYCKNTKLVKYRIEFLQLLYEQEPQLRYFSDISQILDYIMLCIKPELTFTFSIYLDKIHKLLKKKKTEKMV